jgi:hypothetical protein
MRLFISLQNDSLRVLRGMYPEIGDAWDLFMGIKDKNFAAFKELFPDLYREIRIQIREELEKESRGDAYKSLLDEIKALQAKLDSLKSLEAGAMPQAGIKSIGIKPIAAPSFDDDDDLILTAKKDEGAGFKANENFLRSMLNLQK